LYEQPPCAAQLCSSLLRGRLRQTRSSIPLHAGAERPSSPKSATPGADKYVPLQTQGMRIQQRKKRSEAVSERPVEPNEKLGDIKPQLSDELDMTDHISIAREANRMQATDEAKHRPAMMKMPKQAKHNIMQPRPGF
jgi:hypothetical protein